MKSIRWPTFFLSLLLLAPSWAGAGTVSRHTFFEGTQYPLTVYRMRGEEPGPVVMVQGGIQGDEAAGFVSAQLLTRADVRKGGLLVIPRANVPSINARKRQVNVDLNRRFDRDYNRFYEDRLARAIRFLLSGCDAFIHLHEGSGFYNPTYVDKWRNPRRWGQSIIIDASVYKDRIFLARTVSEALSEINRQVTPEDYRFQLFNTRTFARDTPFPEMRKSLTCYALKEVGIPAMAVEVSKNIRDLGWKVKQQLAATAKLLERLGVEIDLPELREEKIRDYAARAGGLRLNGQDLTPGSEITLSPASVLTFQGDGASAEPFSPVVAVFSSDRPEFNLVPAPRMALAPFDTIRIKADGKPVGEVAVRWHGEWPDRPDNAPTVFVVSLNGEHRYVRQGETLWTVAGDQLILEGVWGGRANEILNLKGYVAKPFSNDGQDMGLEIILDPANFIPRYLADSDSGPGKRCTVVRETPGKPAHRFHIAITPRSVYALGLVDGYGREHVVSWRPGTSLDLAPGAYTVRNAWSNGPEGKLALAAGREPLPWGMAVQVAPDRDASISLRQATTFEPLGRMRFKAKNLALAPAGKKVRSQ